MAFLLSKFRSAIVSRHICFVLNANYSSAPALADKQPPKRLKINKKVLQKLEELFSIRTYLALDIITNHQKLSAISTRLLTHNFELCRHYNVNSNKLLENVDVLAEGKLGPKLALLSELSLPVEKTLFLATMNHDDFERLILKLKKEETRIQKLADILKTTPEFVCEAMVKMKFLTTKDVNRIKTDVELLTSYGVDIHDIRRDLWVLRYSTEHLQERLKFAKDNNVERIKTWMMRATSEIFDTYLKRRSDNKSVLGDSSLIEYLSNKLECSTEFAKSILQRQPALKNKSMKKMKEIIDFLLSQGFETVHICRVPKILLHSVETSKKRLKELDEQGVHMKSVHILTKSQRQYRQYYESLLKINQMKMKKGSSESNVNNNDNEFNSCKIGNSENT